jgi:hypothetical protein
VNGKIPGTKIQSGTITSNLLATTTGVPAPFIALALIIGTTIVILAAFGATALYAIWKDR